VTTLLDDKAEVAHRADVSVKLAFDSCVSDRALQLPNTT
jgi:hypothetical protein